jgi:hypothetical protein
MTELERLHERLHGEEGARRAVQGHLKAVDRIEAIVSEEYIDFDLERRTDISSCRRGNLHGTWRMS